MINLDNLGTEETRPLQAISAKLTDTLSAVSDTALRILAERNEALRLLRRTLEMREMGNQGVHKSSIRDFLRRIGELPSDL